jgi:hypothetical protein
MERFAVFLSFIFAGSSVTSGKGRPSGSGLAVLNLHFHCHVMVS